MPDRDAAAEKSGALVLFGATGDLAKKKIFPALYRLALSGRIDVPIIGVNTFLSSKGSPTILPKEVIRATEEEKEAQIATVENLRTAYADEAAKAIKDLQQAAIKNENMFEVLMEATKYCSLGQLTAAMFEVGGVSEEYVMP